jgi:DNA-binding transcriptional MerR regulator
MIDKSPDAFRTISEAAEDLDLPQHVLRFWETRFPQIKPLKRGGGRRYYRPDDVDFLRGLKHLLHAERYTIKGVQKIIKEQGQKAVQAVGRSGIVAASPAPASPASILPAPVSSAPVFSPSPTPVTTPFRPVPMRASIQTKPQQSLTMRGKLEAALAELTECRRIISGFHEA